MCDVAAMTTSGATAAMTDLWAERDRRDRIAREASRQRTRSAVEALEAEVQQLATTAHVVADEQAALDQLQKKASAALGQLERATATAAADQEGSGDCPASSCARTSTEERQHAAVTAEATAAEILQMPSFILALMDIGKVETWKAASRAWEHDVESAFFSSSPINISDLCERHVSALPISPPTLPREIMSLFRKIDPVALGLMASEIGYALQRLKCSQSRMHLLCALGMFLPALAAMLRDLQDDMPANCQQVTAEEQIVAVQLKHVASICIESIELQSSDGPNEWLLATYACHPGFLATLASFSNARMAHVAARTGDTQQLIIRFALVAGAATGRTQQLAIALLHCVALVVPETALPHNLGTLWGNADVNPKLVATVSLIQQRCISVQATAK